MPSCSFSPKGNIPLSPQNPCVTLEPHSQSLLSLNSPCCMQSQGQQSYCSLSARVSSYQRYCPHQLLWIQQSHDVLSSQACGLLLQTGVLFFFPFDVSSQQCMYAQPALGVEGNAGHVYGDDEGKRNGYQG